MVTYFTKKDLEYCLQALGAPRTGKKQVLQANLLHACGVGHNQQRLEGFGDLRARQARQLVADK